MKRLLMITASVLILSTACKKKQTTTQQTSNNATTSTSGYCNIHRACYEGIYEYKLDANSQNWADTVMSGCQIQFTFVGYFPAPAGHNVRDSVKYSVTAKNFNGSVAGNNTLVDFYSSLDAFNNYYSFYTKAGHHCLFEKLN